MYITFRYDIPLESEENPYNYFDIILKELTHTNVLRIIQYIQKHFMKYAIAYEISEITKKPHLQGKIYITKDIETVRKNMKKDLGFFNKSNYSLAPIKDEEKYDSYICKDGKLLINNCFTEDEIITAILKHKEVIVKNEEVSKLTFTQRIARDYKIENECGIIKQFSYSNACDLELNKAHEHLLKYILKRLGKVVKCFDERELQKIYNGVKNSIIYENEDTLERQVQFYSKRIEL